MIRKHENWHTWPLKHVFSNKNEGHANFSLWRPFSTWLLWHTPFCVSPIKSIKKITIVVIFQVMLIYIILWYDVWLSIEFLYKPMRRKNPKWPPIDRKYTKNRTNYAITHFYLGFCYMEKNKRSAGQWKLTFDVLFFVVSPIYNT